MANAGLGITTIRIIYGRRSTWHSGDTFPKQRILQLKRICANTRLGNGVTRYLTSMHYINNKTGKVNTAEEIEKVVIVFDLKDLGMSPDLFGINYCRDMFGVDGNYYPER